MQRNRYSIVQLLIAALCTGCTSETESQTVEVPSVPPASVSSTEDSTDQRPYQGPNLTFERDEHDFGKIWDDKSVSCIIPFSNNGTETLVISRMKAGCGCTTPKADKTVLQPGEESVIRIEFNPTGKSKKQDKKVTIFSNDSLEPEKTFWIRSFVQPVVEVSPKFVQLDEMTMGIPASRTFTFVPAADDFVITEMKGTGKHGSYVTGEEIEVPEGQPRQIKISIAPTMPWGAFHSQLAVTGEGTMPDGSKLTHTFTVFANGKTYGKLRADDFIVRLGSLVSGGSYHDRIRIFRTDGEMFEISNVTVLAPTVQGMNATSVQVPSPEGMAYEIVVSGTVPPSYVGQVGGELLVQTNVPGEEILRFRITGVIPKR